MSCNLSAYTGTSNLEVMEEAVRYNRFLLGLILPLSLKSKRVLDFGAGTGTFAHRLRDQGVDVVCVEPDPDLRRQLQAKGLTVYSGIFDVPDESIDFVYSFNVLEHIEDDAASLAQLRRALHAGGHLLIYVPAFMLLYGAMDRRVGHVRRYRKAPLRRLVQAAGFTVDDVRHADSLGFLAALGLKVFGPSSGDLNPRAVRVYDKWLFPISRLLDSCLSPIIGKNLVLRAHR